MIESATSNNKRVRPLLRGKIILPILIFLLMTGALLWVLGGPSLSGQERLERGDLFFQKGDYRSARSEYIQAVLDFQRNHDTPNFTRACLSVGRADIRLGDGVHARAFLDDVLEKASNSGEREEAQSLLKQAETLPPSSPLMTGLSLGGLIILTTGLIAFVLFLRTKTRSRRA